jgi:2,4-dichlorophenol 6-monooxygenase
VPITVHAIGRGTGGPADPYGEWAELREVDCDGCVLVRPDRHVAWRYPCFDAGAPAALRVAMDQVLARGPVRVPHQVLPAARPAPGIGEEVAVTAPGPGR